MLQDWVLIEMIWLYPLSIWLSLLVRNVTICCGFLAERKVQSSKTVWKKITAQVDTTGVRSSKWKGKLAHLPRVKVSPPLNCMCTCNCDLYCSPILDYKEDVLQCGIVCWLWFCRFVQAQTYSPFHFLNSVTPPFIY